MTRLTSRNIERGLGVPGQSSPESATFVARVARHRTPVPSARSETSPAPSGEVQGPTNKTMPVSVPSTNSPQQLFVKPIGFTPSLKTMSPQPAGGVRQSSAATP